MGGLGDCRGGGGDLEGVAVNRYLFLDIDGVLNNHRWLMEGTRPRGAENDLDPLNCAELKRLCDIAKPQIVISSVWRRLFWPDIRGWLKHYGIAPVIARTKELASRNRSAEIRDWCDTWKEEVGRHQIVILDDEIDDFKGTMIGERLVLTDFTTGLTAQDVDAALTLWNLSR
jgi:hypothetical protein